MVAMNPDRGEEAILTAHDRCTARVAEAVFGLVAAFAPIGMTPAAVLEGAVKGGALAMAHYAVDEPAAIADLLEEMADALRTLPPGAFRPTSQ